MCSRFLKTDMRGCSQPRERKLKIAKMGNKIAVVGQWLLIAIVVILKLRADAIYFLTPDSYHYLHAAQSLLDGKGYHIVFEGRDTFCAIWPVGYSASIAGLAWLTGFSVEISSKIINVLALAGCFGLIYSRFRERAWFISLAFFASSLVQVYANTWSETLFLFFVIGFAAQSTEAMPTKVGGSFWAIGAFLSRYAAVFLAFVLLIQRRWRAALYYLLFVAGYLFFNFSQTKTFTGGHGFWPDEPWLSRVGRGIRGLGEELLFFAVRDWGLKNTALNDSVKWLIYGVALGQLIVVGLIMREFWRWAKGHGIDAYGMTKSSFFRVGVGYLLFTIAIYLTDASIESLYFRRLAPASLLITVGILEWVSLQKVLFERTKWYFVLFFALSIIHSIPK
ncbi:hypothetical protein FHS57_002152 [Runella defluvii]|uniref:Glycosyltransferase RgtA/B/C/D-like domain-containing protein n=1 Tax=Runella defluvii TaxID=370973 RepID=A0A7W5ZIZ6_9BACT|nr:hypothetical protein [Runella defluvii]MBB3838147.1 hypothetical protein [Runella defluvii]